MISYDFIFPSMNQNIKSHSFVVTIVYHKSSVFSFSAFAKCPVHTHGNDSLWIFKCSSFLPYFIIKIMTKRFWCLLAVSLYPCGVSLRNFILLMKVRNGFLCEHVATGYYKTWNSRSLPSVNFLKSRKRVSFGWTYIFRYLVQEKTWLLT